MIVGLCKTFSGIDFVTAAIESVFDFLDKIVFVNSNISWSGKEGNTVKPVVEAWQAKYDTKNKIEHIDCNVDTQLEQYNIGYEHIKEMYNPDWIMGFDSDEVWDYANIQIAKRLLDTSVEYNAIAAHMHTYLKSPFYRVTPPEYCKPTVFFRPVHEKIQGIRGNHIFPRLISPNLYFHHFTYVRDNEQDVFDKIETSLCGDQEDVPMCELIDLKKWKEEKWDKMPKGKDFHTTTTFEKSWHKIKKIKLEDLPVTVRNLPIIEKWKERAKK